ncbi:MAG: cupin domain-containing protein [Syntrophales bacterium]|nr:cupin domain-containing protein [Syntrophales bacterium]MDP3098617.1 cupin domain-containing protein [Syntrophales bacterium]
MPDKQLVFKVDEVKGKIAHGGAATVRILINDISCGAKNFSLLVNTMTAGLNYNVTGAGHSHKEEHCMFGLSGSGGISVDGVKYDVGPNTAVFIPTGAMHYVWANEGQDFTYIIVYSPPGPEKAL